MISLNAFLKEKKELITHTLDFIRINNFFGNNNIVTFINFIKNNKFQNNYTKKLFKDIAT